MAKVKIREEHFLKRSTTRKYVFDTAKDMTLKFSGLFGPKDLADIHADLLDLALAIYHYEKMQNRYTLTNPTTSVSMEISLRKPGVWTKANVKLLTTCLSLMGNTDWEITISKASSSKFDQPAKSNGSFDKLVLFSGGMDSTAGIATIPQNEKSKILLCSFYSRQKTIQREIAADLGFTDDQHFQFWSKFSHSHIEGKNRSFFYRSILFLFVAAVLADSYSCKEIIQFENGILATSISPSPSIIMTRHAHPALHRNLSELFSNLFKNSFSINNPFLTLTKRECVEQAIKKIGKPKFEKILDKTETCWFKYSNFILGGKAKSPNIECGICIPCIIRRTAYPASDFAFDLNDTPSDLRNDPVIGEAFRSYYSFTEQISEIKARSSNRQKFEFYKLLPAIGREYFSNSTIYLGSDPGAELFRMFRKFAQEFHQTYEL